MQGSIPSGLFCGPGSSRMRSFSLPGAAAGQSTSSSFKTRSSRPAAIRRIRSGRAWVIGHMRLQPCCWPSSA